MQTYRSAVKEREPERQAVEREEALSPDIPNSVMINAMGASDATPPSSPSDPNLLSKIRSRGRRGAPGRMQPQMPNAEREADAIASTISAAAATPEAVKAEMGSRLGADFSNVNFHIGGDAVSHADSVGARAYAAGNDIYFGQGGFDPSVAAHELVHTAQQGAVQASAPVTVAPSGGIQMIPKGMKRFFRKFTEAGREKNMQEDAQEALGRRQTMTDEKRDYMRGFGYEGSATMMATPETAQKYNQEVSPIAGGTFKEFTREITGGDDRIQEGEAGKRELKFYDQDLADRLLKGDKTAYIEMITQYVAGIEKFAQTDWAGMSDEELIRNYDKIHVFQRHAISQKQLFDKAKKYFDDVVAALPGGEQEFMDCAFYINNLSAYLNNRMDAMAMGKKDADYNARMDFANMHAPIANQYRENILRRTQQEGGQDEDLEMEDVPEPEEESEVGLPEEGQWHENPLYQPRQETQPEPEPEIEPEPVQETQPETVQEEQPRVFKLRGKIEDLKNSKKRGPLLNSFMFRAITSEADKLNSILGKERGTGEVYRKNCMDALTRYDRLVKKCDEYLEARKNAKTEEGQARLDIVRQIRDLAVQDMPGLRDSLVSSPVADENATMFEVVGKASRTEKIDLTGKQVTKHGSAASERLKFEHGGKEVFFTRETTLRDDAGNKDDAVADCLPCKTEEDKARNAGFRKILDCGGAVYNSLWGNFKDNPTAEDLQKSPWTELEGGTKADFIRKKFKGKYKDDEWPINFDDDAVCEQLFSFLIAANKALEGKKLQREITGMGENQTISGRNAAMSRVAELLGIGDIVAKSTNAEITQTDENGQTQTRRGNVMEKAEGTAPLDMQEKGTLKNLDVSSGKVQQQLINLQLLDTLCAQCDRHIGNYFVQQDEEGKATGITGIDNDMAFGKAGTDFFGNQQDFLDVGANWMPVFFNQAGRKKDGLDVGGQMTLPVVDGNVAKRIMSLTPETLELVIGDIVTDKSDLDGMKARLKRMQGALKQMQKQNPKAFIYDDKDWGEETKQKLLEATNDEEVKKRNVQRYKNYFKRLQEQIELAKQGKDYF